MSKKVEITMKKEISNITSIGSRRTRSIDKSGLLIDDIDDGDESVLEGA